MPKKQKPAPELLPTALPPYFSAKVVTAAEMARVEKLAVKAGFSEEKFVREAGRKIALAAMKYIEERTLSKCIYLLIGKGNKGADAYAAGAALLEEGFRVKAFACFPSEACSEWNRKLSEEFVRRRGQKVPFYAGEEMSFEEGLIIDGLIGTGFKGKIEGKVETAILISNASKNPILAIDLPSGLDGTTGEAKGTCIEADLTVTLGMAKSGLFFREGWNHTGRLLVEDFGLPSQFVDLAQEIAYLPDVNRLPLPKIIRNRHKYQAGYVIGYAGSETMRGAPKLAGLAALRAGAGIVRVFHKGEIGETPMELISQKWTQKEWSQELKRAGAVFIGPGLGTSSKNLMSRSVLPIVFDADALQKRDLLSEPSGADPSPRRNAPPSRIEKRAARRRVLRAVSKVRKAAARYPRFKRGADGAFCERQAALDHPARGSGHGNRRSRRCTNRHLGRSFGSKNGALRRRSFRRPAPRYSWGKGGRRKNILRPDRKRSDRIFA